MIGPLIDGAIKRRKVVLGVAIIAAIFGFFAYLSMPRESNPDIDFPYIQVFVPYPGVSPEDSERLLVKPLEVQLQTIQGIKHMNAVARQGAAIVALEFEADFDKDKALADVRAKVDLARGRFPPDAEEPIINEQSSAEPVVGIVLYGAAPERQLHQAAMDLRERLESMPGVLEVYWSGGREEVLEVTIDPLRMEAYNVTTGELAQVIGRNNQLVPAGNLRSGGGQFAVKVPGVVEDPADVLALPIKKNGDRIVTVGDIGEVRRTFKEPTSISRYNGQPAYVLEVTKRSGSNILKTVEDIKKLVEADAKRWPATIRHEYMYDSSDFIARTLNVLEGGLITASLLVMMIIVASLGIRQGLMVGLAIPVCFMIGLLMISGMGITLNQMVMFGMVLAVGILVDGGIVVVEYADRKMAEGLTKEEAFAAAGKRMFWPVVNGTLTTLCAFVPFMFWNSIAGKFMSFLPLTLFFVLGASIFVAVIFTPALGSIFGRKAAVDEAHLADIARSEHGDPREMSGFMGWYARTVEALGKRPTRSMAAAFAIVLAIGVWFGVSRHRTEFFLEQDPEWVAVFVKARGNLSPEAQNSLVAQVERRMADVKGVQAMYVRAGGFSANGGPNAAPNDTIGRIRVDFVDFDARKALGRRGEDIADEIRERVADLPGLQTEVRKPEGGPPVGKDIQVQLQSHDPAALDRAANLVKAKLASDPQLINLEDNRTSPGIEYNLTVDRAAAGRYGVDVLTVGQTIQFLTGGVLMGRFRPDDAQDELDIRVRFPAEARTVAAFNQLKITTPQGPVPVSYFIKRTPTQQVTQIQRREGQRLVIVQGNYVDGVASNQKIAALKPWLEKAPIDPAVTWKFVGADEEGQEAVGFFVGAMAAALFMMFVILLWQFNSFYGVFVTLSAVILSTIGVLLGIQVNLLHTFDYISVIMVGTGVVALFGVVVGHNIVLVDTFYQLRRQGYAADEAAMRAATQRFRPVLLTTLVTVAGLLPLMFAVHPNFRNGHVEYRAPGSEWWVQLSAAVVWGLSFATLLTLVLTPVMLAAPKVYSARFMRLRERLGLGPRRPRTPSLVIGGDDDLPRAAE